MHSHILAFKGFTMQNNYFKSCLVFLFALSILFLSGCGSKYYFKPEKGSVEGEVFYNGNLPSSIKSVVRNGATLKNGQFITKYGEISNIRLKREARYLNASENYYIIHRGNILTLINKSDNKETHIELDDVPVSANIDDNLIAIVFETNTVAIYDTKRMEVVYRQENVSAPANNTLIASPYFLNDIIVFPTLDGKLVVVERNTMRLVRNIVVNGDKYFNNVIFLESIENRMVAATPKRIISVSPNVINTFDVNLKDILFLEDRIFIFSNEGEVILTDKDLNEIRRIKFPFAHFSAASYGHSIAILETQGYMIFVDNLLQNSTIKKLPSAISKPTFSTLNRIYVDDKFFNIP